MTLNYFCILHYSYLQVLILIVSLDLESLRKLIQEDRLVKVFLKGGSMAEWFRVLDLKSGGPWFKSSTLLLSGFVLGSPEFNSSTALCK